MVMTDLNHGLAHELLLPKPNPTRVVARGADGKEALPRIHFHSELCWVKQISYTLVLNNTAALWKMGRCLCGSFCQHPPMLN